MKITLIYIVAILTSINMFGQSQDSLDIDNAFHKCLSEARLPKPDTLDCYPPLTNMWLDIVKMTYESLDKKLKLEERKKLYENQMRWENSKNVEYDQYNLIIADKSRPLSERRNAVKKEFQIAQDRALHLLKYLKSLSDK